MDSIKSGLHKQSTQILSKTAQQQQAQPSLQHPSKGLDSSKLEHHLVQHLDLILQSLTLLCRVPAVLVVPALLPSVGIIWVGHLPWRRDQLGVESLVKNPSSLDRQGCVPREPDWSVPVVSALVVPLTRSALTVLVLFVLLSAVLRTGLVTELSSSSCLGCRPTACTGCQQRVLDVGLSPCDAWQRPSSDFGCSLPPC